MRNKKSLCPLPWAHISVDFDESLRICCNSGKGREVVDNEGKSIYFSEIRDFQDVINLNFFKEARREMINGELPSYCSNCKKIDEANGNSPRQYFLNQYESEMKEWLKQTDDDGQFTSSLSSPLFLDFSFGNKCNLKCRMCSPVFSSSLKKTFDKINLEKEYSEDRLALAAKGWTFSDATNNLLIEWFSKIDKILLQGGEPFVTSEVWDFLNLAIKSGHSRNIYLKITSNLTVLTTNQIKILTQFKAVAIHVSIEGTESVNEYIRQGVLSRKVYDNIKKIDQLKKIFPITYDIYTVLQIYNIENIVPFLNEIYTRFAIIPHFGFLRYPHYLSVNILPTEKKLALRKEIENYLDSLTANNLIEKNNIETLRSLLDVMDEEVPDRDILWERMLYYTKELDKIYQTNIRKISNFLGEECYGK